MSDAAASPYPPEPSPGEPGSSAEPTRPGSETHAADPRPAEPRSAATGLPPTEPGPYQPGWVPPAVPSASFMAPAPHGPPPLGTDPGPGPYARPDGAAPAGAGPPAGVPLLAAPVGPRYTGPPELRHPLDPDVRPSTKAGAVLFLGVVAVAMMLCVGGVIPAILALVLARTARAELRASQGFLTGEKQVRAGIVLSWIAIAVSTTIVISAVVYVLIRFGATSGPSFGTNVN